MGGNLQSLDGHVIICNCNEMVRSIVDELQAGTAHTAMDVVLIVQDEDLWRQNAHWHPRSGGLARFHVLAGSPTDKTVLGRAGIERAKAAIILGDPGHGRLADAPSALTAMAIEKQSPQVHTVIELTHAVNREHLNLTEVDEVVCLGDVSEMLLARACLTPGVTRIFAHLLTTQKGTAQIFVPFVAPRIGGTSFRELARRAIVRDAPYIIIGFIKNEYENAPSGGSGVLPGKTAKPWEIAKFHKRRIFAVNPGAGTEPGKDSPLYTDDQLVIMSYSQPDLSLLQ